MKNKIFTCLFGVAVFFFIITFSIGLPIYCRFFYYLQINPLGLPEATGYSYDVIKSSFDAVLNYLTLPGYEFSTGVFAYSESGKAHFADCKVLFDLNLIVLLISSAIMILTLILVKAKKIELLRPLKMNVAFLSALSIFAVAIILVIIVAIDFSSAFVVFHHLFFPGKTNWQFNPFVDEILNILPEQFFMNCAILIGASILIICLSIIIFQLVKRRKESKKG